MTHHKINNELPRRKLAPHRKFVVFPLSIGPEEGQRIVDINLKFKLPQFVSLSVTFVKK